MRSNQRLKVGLVVVLLFLAGIVATPAAMGNGLNTTDVSVSANPPASGPTDAVTYTATVSNPTATSPNVATTPTGSVDFTYQVIGTQPGRTLFDLGSVPLQGLQAGTAVASITITPASPPATVNGGAALPVGDVVVTAAYSGDATFAATTATTTDFIDVGCRTGPWPEQTSGVPEVFARYPEGYYIGQVNGWWSLFVTHPSDGQAINFTGSVKTTGQVLDVTAIKGESNDSVTLKGSTKIAFDFRNRSLLDGITFYAGCGAKLTIKTMINGAKASTAEANLGNPTSNPSHHLVFKRSS
jgi:hypothetical protein